MTATALETSLSPVVIALFKGPVYRESGEALWTALLNLRAQVVDHMAVVGLALVVDEAEGFAFLRSREDPDAADLPRLWLGDMALPSLSKISSRSRGAVVFRVLLTRTRGLTCRMACTASHCAWVTMASCSPG